MVVYFGSIYRTINGLMAFPNLVALLALNGEVVSETRGYLERIGIMKTAVDEA